ncbi:hypothetical protein N7501_002930 [Penicillium viridicatum]|nr:hypothetical protein N7501_002930 [Penicillium viridicatum]
MLSFQTRIQRDEDTLDFQRCARLHNYLVAYAYMARNGTNTPVLDALATESWFFNQPNENIEAIRARLDPSLNSFLDLIYDPTPGFFYWIDSTVAAMDRYTDAIESRMQSLLPISRDAPFCTNAELDAALVLKECFIRSFLTRVKTLRFKLIAPGLEVPHDKEAFTARQMFNTKGQGRDVPSFLLFASADDSRKISFNEEIHRLYSATVNRFEYDSEETGFHLLLPFALRPNLAEDGARRSDGTLLPSGSFTQLFQHGVFHPFGGEHRAQRLERLLDRWTELIESGVWTVGENGVGGGIDMFQDGTEAETQAQPSSLATSIPSDISTKPNHKEINSNGRNYSNNDVTALFAPLLSEVPSDDPNQQFEYPGTAAIIENDPFKDLDLAFLDNLMKGPGDNGSTDWAL